MIKRLNNFQIKMNFWFEVIFRKEWTKRGEMGICLINISSSKNVQYFSAFLVTRYGSEEFKQPISLNLAVILQSIVFAMNYINRNE